MKIRAPYIQVFFTTVSGDSFEVVNKDFGGDLISLNTTKKISEPAGTWTLTLVGRTNFYNFVEKFHIKNVSKVTGYDLFRPAGLVDIYINGKEKMIGMIDRISKRVVMNDNGKPQRNWTISGRDLGAVLIDHKIWYDCQPSLERQSQNSYWFGMNEFAQIYDNNSTANIVETIFNKWMVDVVNKTDVPGTKAFSFADGKGITDKLVVKRATGGGALSLHTYSDIYQIQLNLYSQQCDLMNFINGIASAPFNEVFVDTGDCNIVLADNPLSTVSQQRIYNNITGIPDTIIVKSDQDKSIKAEKGKAYLVYRASPFDDEDLIKTRLTSEGYTSTWFQGFTQIKDILHIQKLNQYFIDDSVIKEKELSISRTGAVSVYSLKPSEMLLPNFRMDLVNPPEYDEVALRRYGYNPVELTLQGFSNEGTKTDTLLLAKEMQKKAKNWFQYKDSFLVGTFVIAGDQDIRIGNCLNYMRDENNKIEDDYTEGHYYITGLTDNWVFGQSYLQTIEVDRGVSKLFYR